MSEQPATRVGLAPEESGVLTLRSGRQVWHRVNGRDADGVPLVVVHGGPSLSHDYLSTLTDLADERPVHFYDQSDTGRSPRTDTRELWNVEAYTDELRDLVDALGFDGPFIIVGHSWGATLAIEYASRHPEGLAGLVLASPLVSTARWVEDTRMLREELPADVRATMERCEAAGDTDGDEYQAAVDVYMASFMCRSDPWPPELLECFEHMNAEQLQTLWGKYDFAPTGTLVGYDGTSLLSRIEVPTLVTCGEHDECHPASAAEYAETIADALVSVTADCAHFPHLERREQWMTAVGDWLRPLAR